jgi:hypothetical protein
MSVTELARDSAAVTVLPSSRHHGLHSPSLTTPIASGSNAAHYSPQTVTPGQSTYHPVFATRSLGSHTVMHYHDLPAQEPVLSLLLEPLSLVITARISTPHTCMTSTLSLGTVCELTRRCWEGG